MRYLITGTVAAVLINMLIVLFLIIGCRETFKEPPTDGHNRHFEISLEDGPAVVCVVHGDLGTHCFDLGEMAENQNKEADGAGYAEKQLREYFAYPKKFCERAAYCEDDDSSDTCVVAQEKCGAHSKSIVTGYYDEKKEFRPWQCERTEMNGNGLGGGVERFQITTGPDHETVCKNLGYVTDADCEYRDLKTGKKQPDNAWRGKMVKIDYRKQHEVCVTHMPGLWLMPDGAFAKDKEDLKKRVYQGDVTRCFDLYDIGER